MRWNVIYGPGQVVVEVEGEPVLELTPDDARTLARDLTDFAGYAEVAG